MMVHFDFGERFDLPPTASGHNLSDRILSPSFNWNKTADVFKALPSKQLKRPTDAMARANDPFKLAIK
jgi:hypothetical protein